MNGEYHHLYKTHVIRNFIQLLGNKLGCQLDYVPKQKVERKIGIQQTYNNQSDVLQMYEKAKFDNKLHNVFEQDDKIEGVLEDNTKITIADIHIQHHTGSGSKSNTEEIFQGLFVNMDCNKDLGCYLKITKNKFKITNTTDGIQMDNTEFEKYFDIDTDNQTIAFQLLTSDIMLMLVDFRKKYDIDFEIVIRNNTIYLRFFTGPMFETSVWREAMDKQQLFMYYTVLKFVIDVSKEVRKTVKEAQI